MKVITELSLYTKNNTQRKKLEKIRIRTISKRDLDTNLSFAGGRFESQSEHLNRKIDGNSSIPERLNFMYKTPVKTVVFQNIFLDKQINGIL